VLARWGGVDASYLPIPRWGQNQSHQARMSGRIRTNYLSLSIPELVCILAWC
jgi:hypothetical protein